MESTSGFAKITVLGNVTNSFWRVPAQRRADPVRGKNDAAVTVLLARPVKSGGDRRSDRFRPRTPSTHCLMDLPRPTERRAPGGQLGASCRPDFCYSDEVSP
jgi:hypothetical protein